LDAGARRRAEVSRTGCACARGVGQRVARRPSSTVMKLSYAHGVSTRPLIGMTLGGMLDEVAQEFAGQEALVSVFENRRLTYAAFREEVNRCARALLALGVQKGDRVGIWSTNCLAWVLVQFATAKIDRKSVV